MRNACAPSAVEQDMVMRPFVRFAALYAVVELAAFGLLVWAFGLGWALLVLAVTFMVGVVLSASQLKGLMGDRRLAMRRARRDPQRAVADGALVGLGSFLVFLPGLVSTAVGALMLAPPTRSAMRPLASTMISRGVLRGARAVNMEQAVDRFTGPGRGDVIDGEVLSEVRGYQPVVRTAVLRRGGI